MAVQRRGFLGRMGAVGAFAAGALPALEAHGNSVINPDPQHIKRRINGWIVLPNGEDDHNALEWAMSNTPRGGYVRLVRGTYKVGSPVVVADFDGWLIGAGTTKTTVTCSDEFSYEVWDNNGNAGSRPPSFPRVSVNGSLTKTPPTFIQVYRLPVHLGGSRRPSRITIRDIRFRGAMLHDDLWMFGDETLCVNISNVVDWNQPDTRQETVRQDVTIRNVEVDGYKSASFGIFENGCACITVLGSPVTTPNYNGLGVFDGDAIGAKNGGLIDVVPAQGDVTFKDCIFRNCRLGPGVVGYKDGTVRMIGNEIDGCRGNCMQLIDLGNMEVIIRDNDLFCDPFVLPGLLTAGIDNLPSSLGCIVAIQGFTAVYGVASNIQYLALSKPANPDNEPLEPWMPQGPGSAPAPSRFWIINNSCRSSETINTYCFHLVDGSNLAFGQPTLSAVVNGNSCDDSETCISLEHVAQALVTRNDCHAEQFGVELHNSRQVRVRDNDFEFPSGAEQCEIRSLQLGDKLDLSRVRDGAGTCSLQ